MSWIDISVPLKDGMVCWPGDPAVRIRRIQSIAGGDPCNVSALSMSAHTGTHMDAPLHFLAGGKSLEEISWDAVMGPARVIRIRDPRSIQPEELKTARIRRGERLLFRTRNSERPWPAQRFMKDYVFITPEAARFLAERKVRTVGVDYLSVGGFDEADAAATHKALLKAGVWLIEGLWLGEARAGGYHLVCLPLRLAADGAPARALLRRRGGSGLAKK